MASPFHGRDTPGNLTPLSSTAESASKIYRQYILPFIAASPTSPGDECYSPTPQFNAALLPPLPSASELRRLQYEFQAVQSATAAQIAEVQASRTTLQDWIKKQEKAGSVSGRDRESRDGKDVPKEKKPSRVKLKISEPPSMKLEPTGKQISSVP